jgi:RNA ligase (TIGR02306 family)
MSIHRVDIIRVEGCDPHPDPETTNLVVVKVGGFSVVVNKSGFQLGNLYCYIQPDSLVKVSRPEFEFLKPRAGDKEFYRVRVMKLRGFYSQGLLIPAPEGFNDGDDAAEFLEVGHYEPPIESVAGGRCVRAPRRKETSLNGLETEVFSPVYDVENYNRFVECFVEGEEVVTTEKVHGSNGRFCVVDGQLYCGSHYTWKADDPQSIWWRAVNNHPEIKEFLHANENMIAYGEVYGRVQGKGFDYGFPNDFRIVLFDILRGFEWVGWDESQAIAETYNLPWVSLVFRGGFDVKLLKSLAEQDSIMPMANPRSIREGLVVKPVTERSHAKLGRVQLKMVSNRYLEKS